jgi:hypothetical protein
MFVTYSISVSLAVISGSAERAFFCLCKRSTSDRLSPLITAYVFLGFLYERVISGHKRFRGAAFFPAYALRATAYHHSWFLGGNREPGAGWLAVFGGLLSTTALAVILLYLRLLMHLIIVAIDGANSACVALRRV